MPLGFETAEWAALFSCLADLCADTSATHATVIDESRVIWCAYHAEARELEASAARVFAREVEPNRE